MGSDLYKTRNRYPSKRKNAEEERELEEKTLGLRVSQLGQNKSAGRAMVGHGNVPIEVAKTVLEVAEVAWSAIETHHHIHQHHHDHDYNHDHDSPPSNHDLESLRTENRRLRSLLQKNLELLQDLSHSPCLSKDCPPDVRIPFSVSRLVSQILSSIFIYLFIFLRRFIWNSRLEKKIVHRQHTFGCL